MVFALHPNKHPFNMLLSIQVFRPVKLRLTVFDPKNKRIYAERRMRLLQNTRILVKMPIVPDELTAKIVNENLPDGIEHFALENIKITADTKCPVELTDADRKFISFIKWFAVELDSLQTGPKGTIYQSEGFSILYLDTITEGETELSTPARIERSSGMIEVSKKAVADYTVPMLMVMFLHEYAHKYKNPEYGKDVANELTADIIAVHIALNLGFDHIEVENCFKAMFSKKDTELNRRRMDAVSDFIKLFRRDEQQRCKCHETRSK